MSDARLRAHIAKLAGEIGQRNVFRPAALHAAADYIRREWTAMSYDVAIQSYQAAGVLSESLEVTRTGQSRPSEMVLIGAHYDSVQGSPANDNASGVAALLEISREFA
jgi:acetylornithine deacetylase/succinyl-diaminopimelate desuccinylase-like protein